MNLRSLFALAFDQFCIALNEAPSPGVNIAANYVDCQAKRAQLSNVKDPLILKASLEEFNQVCSGYYRAPGMKFKSPAPKQQVKAVQLIIVCMAVLAVILLTVVTGGSIYYFVRRSKN